MSWRALRLHQTFSSRVVPCSPPHPRLLPTLNQVSNDEAAMLSRAQLGEYSTEEIPVSSGRYVASAPSSSHPLFLLTSPPTAHPSRPLQGSSNHRRLGRPLHHLPRHRPGRRRVRLSSPRVHLQYLSRPRLQRDPQRRSRTRIGGPPRPHPPRRSPPPPSPRRRRGPPITTAEGDPLPRRARQDQEEAGQVPG